MEKVNGEYLYTYKEMENAVHLSADIFMDLYEKWGDMRAVAEFLIQKATELDERLEGKNEDEGNYDYVEELEKFEKEIRISIEPIKDFSTKDFEPDLVRCNNCMTKMYVDYDTDICPCCGKEGCLMDIES